MSPLLYAYNNPENQKNIIIGDFPNIIYREHVSNLCDIPLLEDIKKIKIEEF
jgi:hypothetical protein